MESQTLNMFLSFVGYTPSGGDQPDPGSILYYNVSTSDLISGFWILFFAICFCIAMFVFSLSIKKVKVALSAKSQTRAINRANNKVIKKSGMFILISFVIAILCSIFFVNSISFAYSIRNAVVAEPGLIYSENVQNVVSTDTGEIQTEAGFINNSSNRDFSLETISVDLTREGKKHTDLNNTIVKVECEKGVLFEGKASEEPVVVPEEVASLKKNENISLTFTYEKINPDLAISIIDSNPFKLSFNYKCLTLDIPTIENLTYTGKELTAITDGYGYTVVDGNKGINAGEYTATVALKEGFNWIDGSTAQRKVAWKIDGAPLRVITYGSAKMYDATEISADGQISGFVNNEFAPFETTGSQTNAGKSKNTYIIYWDDASSTAQKANYVIEENIGDLIVTPRPITATTGSATKQYDGTPLICHDIVIGGEGWIGEDGAIWTVTGTITNAGTEKNTCTYELKPGTKESNYDFQLFLGVLTVTPLSVDIEIVGYSQTVSLKSYEQSVKGYSAHAIFDTFDENKISPKPSECVAKRKDVGQTNMNLFDKDWKYSDTNYNPTFSIISDGWIKIINADVIINISGSIEEYTYDSLVRSVNGYTASVNDEEFLLDKNKIIPQPQNVNVVGKNVGVYYEGLNNIDWKYDDTSVNVAFNVVNDGILTINPYKVDVPTPQENLVYNGTVQLGFYNPGVTGMYDIRNGEAKDAGDYVATAHLWKDDTLKYPNILWNTYVPTEQDQQIEWSIAPFKVSLKWPEETACHFVYDGNAHFPMPQVIAPLLNDSCHLEDYLITDEFALFEKDPVELGQYIIFANRLSNLNYVFAEDATLYCNFNIIEKKIKPPSLSDNTYVYDGHTKSPLVTYGDTDYYEITGHYEEKDVGKYTIIITINKPGSCAWEDGSTLPINLAWSITPASLNITTDSGEKIYDGIPLTAPAHYNGLQEGDSIVVNVTGSQTSVGSSTNTYVIDWGSVKQANYTVADQKGTLTVTNATFNLSVTDQVYDYDSLEHGEGAIVSDVKGSQEVSYTYTYDGQTSSTAPKFINATESAININVTASAPYHDNVTKSYTIIINKTNLVININGNVEDKQYSGSLQTMKGYNCTAYKNKGGALIDAGVAFNINKISPSQNDVFVSATNVGSYEEDIDGRSWSYDDPNVSAVFPNLNDGILTITKQFFSVNLNGNSSEVTYNGLQQQVSGYTATSQSPYFDANKINIKPNECISAGTNAGIYYMNLSSKAWSYNDVNAVVTFQVQSDGVLTISKKSVNPPTVLNFTYDKQEHRGLDDPSSDSGYTVQCLPQVNAGNYTATATLLNPNNYTWEDNNSSSITFEWYISQREVTLDWDSVREWTYDKNSHCPEYTLQNILSGDNITANIKGAAVNAGNHTAYASSLVGVNSQNYKLMFDATVQPPSCDFVIKKQEVEKPKANTNIEYNATINVGIDTPSSSDLYEIKNLSGYSNMEEDAGDYKTLLVLKDPDNYQWKDEDPAQSEVEIPWSIVKFNLENANPSDIRFEVTNPEFDGNEKLPEVKVYFKNKEIDFDSNFEIDPSSKESDAGEYMLTIKAKEESNFSSEVSNISWSIEPKTLDLNQFEISFASNWPVYNGEEQNVVEDAQLKLTSKDGTELIFGEDFIIKSGGNSTNVDPNGQKFVIEGINNYKGTLSHTWYIQPKNLQEAFDKGEIEVVYDTEYYKPFVYDGDVHTVDISNVHDIVNDINLTNDDFTFSCDSHTDANENYECQITGKGNYTGTINPKWKILPATIDEIQIIGNKEYVNYDALSHSVSGYNAKAVKDGQEIVFDDSKLSPSKAECTVSGTNQGTYLMNLGNKSWACTSSNYIVNNFVVEEDGVLKIFPNTGLKVTLETDKEVVKSGDEVTYTVTIENTSEDTMTNLAITILGQEITLDHPIDPHGIEEQTVKYTVKNKDFSAPTPQSQDPKFIANVVVDYKINDGSDEYKISSSNTLNLKRTEIENPVMLDVEYNGTERLIADKENGSSPDGYIYRVTGAYKGKEAMDYHVTVTLHDPSYKWENTDNLSYEDTWHIRKKDLTVTAKNANIQFGANLPDLSYEASGFVTGESANDLSGSPIFTVLSEEEEVYKPFDPCGEYTIKIMGLTSNNYNISFVDGKLTVGKIHISYKWDENTNTLIYNGNDNIPGWTIEGLPNKSELSHFSVQRYKGADDVESSINVGEYTLEIIPDEEMQSNYIIDGVNTHNYKIVPKPVQIDWSKQQTTSWLYDGQSHAPNLAEVWKKDIIGSDSVGVSEYQYFNYNDPNTPIGPPKELGRYFAKVSKLDNNNYSIMDSAASINFSITKIVVQAPLCQDDGYAWEYNGKENSIILKDSVDQDKFTKTDEKAKDAGTYTAKFHLISDNYEWDTTGSSSDIVIHYSVSAKTLKVNTYDMSKYYDATPLVGGGLISSFVQGEGVDSDGHSIFHVTGAQTNAGSSLDTYNIDWDAAINTTNKNNYKVVENVGLLNVNMVPVKVASPSETKEYNQEPLKCHGDYTYTFPEPIKDFPQGEGFICEPDPNAEILVAGSITNAFSIKGNSSTDLNNYNISYDPGVLTIIKVQKKVIVSGGNYAGVYDGMPHNNHTLTTSNLCEGESITANFIDDVKDAGTYSNTFSNVKTWFNSIETTGCYEFEVQPGIIRIEKRPAFITSNDNSWVYDGIIHTEEQITISGFVTNEGVNCTDFATISDVGEKDNMFSYSAKSGTKLDNYDVTLSYGKLSITSASFINVIPPSVQTFTYARNASGEVKQGNPATAQAVGGQIVTIHYSIDGGQTYTTEVPQITWGTQNVMFYASAPNHKNSDSQNYTIEIVERTLRTLNVKTAFVYNFQEFSCITLTDPSEVYYVTFTNNTKINAGSYTATASLVSHCKWADGTYDTKSANWTISQKQVSLVWSMAFSPNPTYDPTKIYKPTVTKINDVCSGDTCTASVVYKIGTSIVSQMQDAATYTIEATLSNNNYFIKDKPSFTINKATVPAPISAGNLPIPSSGNVCGVSNFNSNTMKYTGTLYASSSGVYHVFISLTDTKNFTWADTSKTPTFEYTIDWSISNGSRTVIPSYDASKGESLKILANTSPITNEGSLCWCYAEIVPEFIDSSDDTVTIDSYDDSIIRNDGTFINPEHTLYQVVFTGLKPGKTTVRITLGSKINRYKPVSLEFLIEVFDWDIDSFSEGDKNFARIIKYIGSATDTVIAPSLVPIVQTTSKKQNLQIGFFGDGENSVFTGSNTVPKIVNFENSVSTDPHSNFVLNKNAFKDVTTLQEVWNTDMLQWIDDYACYGCTNLTRFGSEENTVTVTTSEVAKYPIPVYYRVTRMGEDDYYERHLSFGVYAFANCPNIKKFYLAKNSDITDRLYRIPPCAFYNCSSLQEAKIEVDIASVGPLAFDSTAASQSTKMKAFVATNSNTGNESILAGCKNYKPTLSEKPVLTDDIQNIHLTSNVTSVATRAFDGCTWLKTVVVDDPTVTGIGRLAFANCSKLYAYVVRNANSNAKRRYEIEYNGTGFNAPAILDNTGTKLETCTYDDKYVADYDFTYLNPRVQKMIIAGAPLLEHGQILGYDKTLVVGGSDNALQYTELSKWDSTTSFDSNKYYYLTKDIQSSTCVTTKDGHDVVIDFAGHAITSTNSSGALKLAESTKVRLLDTAHYGNESVEHGGGFKNCTSSAIQITGNNYCQIQIYSGEYSGNRATNGAVIYDKSGSWGAAITIYGGTFDDNRAQYGGVVYCNNARLWITGGYYYRNLFNKSDSKGGAIYYYWNMVASGGWTFLFSPLIKNAKFYNWLDGDIQLTKNCYGEAIYSLGDYGESPYGDHIKFDIEDCYFKWLGYYLASSDNKYMKGAALYTDKSGTGYNLVTNVRRCTFIENCGDYGCDIYNRSRINVYDSTFSVFNECTDTGQSSIYSEAQIYFGNCTFNYVGKGYKIVNYYWVCRKSGTTCTLSNCSGTSGSHEIFDKK